jgi:hypothetical protein
MQNFSFVSLSNRSEPRDHKISLEPYFEATRKDPDPKKISRASIDILNLCVKFQDHIWTGSTSIREAKSLLCFNLDVSQFCFDFGKTILNY